ncbi:DUF6896 domain-containing protein [Amycolatopsis sp. NPDC051903]|uniref:DUF6896 domain-containing protein n=1 Tax=Amycolatopsis sp. NPDC051903 TaxID=3363936 RepID=UPI00379982AC
MARGRPARFPLDPQLNWQQTNAAARALQAELAEDDLLVIASPAGTRQPPSLTVLHLIGNDDIERFRDRLESLVTEFRELARQLIAVFRQLVEPAYEQDLDHPESLEANGERWSLHLHGEHCRFQSLTSGAVVEVQIDSPDTLDPWFLLLFAESSDRYPDIRAACAAGFHDMDRMLTRTGISISPTTSDDGPAAAVGRGMPIKEISPPGRAQQHGTGPRTAAPPSGPVLRRRDGSAGPLGG